MPFCCVQHLSDALANFLSLVATSALPVLHVCFTAHSWLPQGTILVNSCNSGDKCNCQNTLHSNTAKQQFSIEAVGRHNSNCISLQKMICYFDNCICHQNCNCTCDVV